MTTTVVAAAIIDPSALGGEYEPLSPAWWAGPLDGKIQRQAAYAMEHDAYYSGDRQLAIMRAEYDRLFGLARQSGLSPLRAEVEPPRSALAAVGVDVTAERLGLLGFSPAVPTSEPSATAESVPASPVRVPEVTEAWRRNDLDVMAPIAHVECLVKGRIINLVWPDKDGRSMITVEDPSQVAVARRSRPPYDVLAGMKVFTDEWTGLPERIVWLPDGMHTLREDRGRLVEDERAFEAAPTSLDGQVPLVEMANRPRLIREPSSALALVTPYADADALLMGWMLIAARFGALPLVTLAGQVLPRAKNPDGTTLLGPDGLPTVRNPYDVRADSLLVAEDPKASWGKLESSNLAGFVATLQEVRVAVRGITKVPALYYGEGTSAGQSGETVRAAETPLVHQVIGLQRPLGHSWRRTGELAYTIDTGKRLDLAAQWASPVTYVQSQAVDALQKYVAAGVPLSVALEQTGMAPEVVAEAVRLAAQQQVDLSSLLDKPLTPPTLLPA